jgi:HlyD family secretion protein
MNKLRVRLVVAIFLVLAALAAALVRTGLWAHWTGQDSQGGVILLSGNIEAHTSVLSFKGVQSRIVQLPFNEGQSVKAGTVVAVLDSRDLTQQVAIAGTTVEVQQRQLDAAIKNVEAARDTLAADRAALAQRELDLKRDQDLQAKGFVSDASLDSARTALTQARAAVQRDVALLQVAERNVKVVQASEKSAAQSLQLSRIQEGNATLVAPFDGVVTTRQAELGEVVAPGTPVITLADLDHVWLRAYLNEADLGRVRLGQEVSVRADSYPGRIFEGKVSFIASQAEFTPKSVETHAERVTLVYRIKIDLDNRDHWLLPGMPADVTIPAMAPP